VFFTVQRVREASVVAFFTGVFVCETAVPRFFKIRKFNGKLDRAMIVGKVV